ncbi:MAG: DUF3641 domain-containing protein [Candidatus Riflebacteria bacterium]|nr:DUF3641 domain-containing protein [Candidatus Riflebacteria bacterium]
MSRQTMEQCLAALAGTVIPTVELTGGAPELNPHFRWFVQQCRALGRHVIDRCNLTVLELSGQQRGEGVYETSIAALKRLNALGYGDGRSGLRLDLVTNPAGAYLPPDQGSLELDWKRELQRSHGIVFDSLFCMTNMPIGRFLQWLEASGNLQGYVERLLGAFNPVAARAVMCRSLLSVGWDGRLYDCDFNQMLNMGVGESAPQHLEAFDLAALEAREIVCGPHCFGCTAGGGSSCGGALARGPEER